MIPLLYHGTSSGKLTSILSRGLLPRGKRRKSNWSEYPSRTDGVYLTTAYAPYFALQAAKSSGDKAVLLEARGLDERKLLPDEDFIAQAISHQKNIPIAEIHSGIRDNLEDFRHHAMDSIAGIGNVFHQGRILPVQISRYVTVEWKSQPALVNLCLDPSISIMNYRFCGEKYRSIISWLFGDRQDFSLGAGWTLDIIEKQQPDFARHLRSLFANRKGIEVFDFTSQRKDSVA